MPQRSTFFVVEGAGSFFTIKQKLVLFRIKFSAMQVAHRANDHSIQNGSSDWFDVIEKRVDDFLLSIGNGTMVNPSYHLFEGSEPPS